jgi:LCP family protein required for cell wall assembly
MKYLDIQKSKKNSDDSTPGISLKIGVIVLIFFVVIGSIIGLMLKFKVKPIEVIANATVIDLKETDGRTNVLVLGSDKRQDGALAGNSVLTDTILVASIGKFDKDVVLISIPRDLWVELSNGGHEKINAVYAIEGYEDSKKGAEGIKKAVEKVLGIPIHYHTLINFEMFKEVVDILGGVDVDVAVAFTDYQYPIEGKENAPENERYETVHFEQGIQHMDGVTALKYARSRKGDNGEGTDFARSRRQQSVIAAIKKKVLNIGILVNPVKLKNLYDTYASNVDTNMDFGTIQNFYMLSQQIDFEKIVSIVLDDRSTPEQGGLLYAPEDNSLYGGKYVLVPETGNYDQIHAYVQKYLFGK